MLSITLMIRAIVRGIVVKPLRVLSVRSHRRPSLRSGQSCARILTLLSVAPLRRARACFSLSAVNPAISSSRDFSAAGAALTSQCARDGGTSATSRHP